MGRVIVADKNGHIDSAYHTLVKHIKSPLPIVMVSYLDDFVFNDELLSLKKDEFILVDFIEMGWDYDWAKHSIETYRKRLNGDEWSKFHEWAFEKPLICFKRELDKPTAEIPGYYPIEYPNITNAYPKQSKSEFENRPIDLLFYWGRSNEKRVQAHGDIWKGASEYGYSVNDNLYYFSEFMKHEVGRKIISLNIPHYGRSDISNLLSINNMSKLSLSLPGAGVKCFRSTGESIVNSVMICEDDNLAWTYPLVHGENCIKIYEPDTILKTVHEALQNTNLYDIYCNSLELADKYRLPNYISHLESIINNA